MRLGINVNRRTLFAAVYLALALAVLVALYIDAGPPTTTLFLYFAVFAVPYVWLEVHSVEVNDKLRVSSSVMVLLSAGVWFGDSALHSVWRPWQASGHLSRQTSARSASSSRL